MSGDFEALEREEKLRSLLIEGARLLRQRQLTAAKQKLQAALELDENCADGLELMGELELAGGNVEGAMDYFRKVAFDLPEAPHHIKQKAEERLGEAALIKAQASANSTSVTAPTEGLEPKMPTVHRSERSPSLAAAFSLLIPGLGEFFARDRMKGLLVMGLWLFVLMGFIVAALNVLGELRSELTGSGTVDGLFKLYFGMWSGTSVIWVVLDHLLRIGSAINAALIAGNGGGDDI